MVLKKDFKKPKNMIENKILISVSLINRKICNEICSHKMWVQIYFITNYVTLSSTSTRLNFLIWRKRVTAELRISE